MTNINLPPTETILSIATLLLTLFSYRAAWTPPQAKASDSVRVPTQNWRLIPKYNREVAAVARLIVSVHFLTECYVLYLSTQSKNGVSLRQFEGICSSRTLLRHSYPAHSNRLPAAMILPIGLILLGAYVRTSAHQALGRMYTWETSLLKTHRLVTGGPYEYVRHPGYTGLALVCAGYMIFLFTPGSVSRECLYTGLDVTGLNDLKSIFAILYPILMGTFLLDAVVFLIRRSWEEDALMKKEFGKEWEQWASRVKWRVFPFIL